jgi:uncharacterized membrane protein YgcG
MRIWQVALLLALGLCNAALARDSALDYAVPVRPQDSMRPHDPPTRDLPRLVLLDLPVRAAERIVNFDSDITVQDNGDLDVAETIEVEATGQQISHGLLRDFPTTYQRRGGTQVKVDFDVRSVTRDGAPEPYALERLSNGVRIRIGSAAIKLAPGSHRFMIRYATSRQIGFFHDYDELYWNVTGNGWTFPIDHATASIHLPQAVPILQSAFYTGPQGARGKDARVTSQGDGRIAFATTEPLGVQEGLTVAAAWRKGAVTPPSLLQIAWYEVRDNLDLAVAMLGFVLLSAYYAFVFMKTRRRTPRQVVPLYEPPRDMSASAIQFLLNKRHGAQGLTLAVMELIALRAMRIDKSDGFPRFRRVEETTRSRQGLERDDMLPALMHQLFRQDQYFSNARDAAGRFQDARSLMQATINLRFGKLIDLHRPLARRGLCLWLLFLASCIGAAWAVDPVSGRNATIIAPFLIVPAAAFTRLYGGLRDNTLSLGLAIFSVIVLLLFLVPPLIALSLGNLDGPLRGLPVILPVLMLPVVIRAYAFARSYTPEGDKVMDQLAGFRQYLALAEGPRLEALATEDEKLQVYERHLPYAIALGVGSKWAAAFAGLTATVAGLTALQAAQDNYGGHHLLGSDPAPGLQGVGSEISSASIGSIPSSSDSPGTSGSSGSDSSSGGSDGGGSSGDGGGGGGGSGW